MNYALTQMSQARYERALAYFERARVYSPHYSILEINLGIVKNVMKKPAAEVEQHYRNSLAYGPSDPQGYSYYAEWLFSIGRVPEARTMALKALEISPAYRPAADLLAKINSRR